MPHWFPLTLANCFSVAEQGKRTTVPTYGDETVGFEVAAVSVTSVTFKAHALGAGAVSNDSIAPTETLFRIGTGSFRPYSVRPL